MTDRDAELLAPAPDVAVDPGDPADDHLGSPVAPEESGSSDDPAGNSTGDLAGDSTGDLAGDSIGDLAGAFPSARTGDSTGDPTAARPGDRPGADDTSTGTRGRQRGALGRLRGDIPPALQLGLGIAGAAVLLGGWTLVSAAMGSDDFLLPTPAATWDAGLDWYRSGDLVNDLGASLRRIGIGYSISLVLGVVFGVLMASFRSAEAFLEPQMGLLRYIPASALTPLFLLWLGIDEAPKIALIAVGTVFFNILMTADVARAVPQELVNASYTLGAGRLTVLRRVILPHSWPGIVDVARINLAAAWLMLVVAELLAAKEGLAYRVVRAQRFRQVDKMFAVLIVFAIIGLVSDLALRQLRRRTAPWSEGSR